MSASRLRQGSKARLPPTTEALKGDKKVDGPPALSKEAEDTAKNYDSPMNIKEAKNQQKRDKRQRGKPREPQCHQPGTPYHILDSTT